VKLFAEGPQAAKATPKLETKCMGNATDVTSTPSQQWRSNFGTPAVCPTRAEGNQNISRDEEEFEMQPTFLSCSREVVLNSYTASLRYLDLEQDLSRKDTPIHFTEWGFLPIVLRDRYPGPDPQIPNDTAYLGNYDSSQMDDTYQNKLDSYVKEVGYWACFDFGTGPAFGLVHLLAWNNHFPTTWELWAWRGASIACAGIPFCFSGRRLYSNAWGLFRYGRWEKRFG
jgi:hypothetical protein